MGVSMQFVIASPWMFLTNRLRQPSDDLAEKDISAKLVSRPKYMDVKSCELSLEVPVDKIDIQAEISSAVNARAYRCTCRPGVGSNKYITPVSITCD